MSEWIKWEGGSQPVEADVMVDVMFRRGHYGSCPAKAGDLRWSHEDKISDITAFRLHQPQQEDSPMTIEQLLAKANRHAAKAAKHERKAAEHEAKRVDAVESARQLMPGYTIEISAKWERDLPEEHTEDMADPANWKAGDVVECITASIGFGGRESFVMGNKYTVSRNYGDGAFLDLAADEYGEANELAAKNFRWVSRPQGESA